MTIDILTSDYLYANRTEGEDCTKRVGNRSHHLQTHYILYSAVRARDIKNWSDFRSGPVSYVFWHRGIVLGSMQMLMLIGLLKL
jgi:hypothetical protein